MAAEEIAGSVVLLITRAANYHAKHRELQETRLTKGYIEFLGNGMSFQKKATSVQILFQSITLFFSSLTKSCHMEVYKETSLKGIAYLVILFPPFKSLC